MIGPAPLSITTSATGDDVVLALTGELDMTSAPALAEQVPAVLDRCNRVVVDMSHLTFCDSSGLAQLLEAARACTAAGGHLRLAEPRPPVLRVLLVTGLLAVLPTFDSLDAALRGAEDERLNG